jgi:ribosomal protein S18 acetylase RimI-like enzyme
MPIPLLVRKAAPGDETAIDQVLIRAFADDPLVNWIVKSDAHRQERVRILIMAAHRLASAHGEVYVTPELTGAALWFPPQDSPTLLENFKLMLGMARSAPVSHLPTVFKGMVDLKAQHPAYPHFFLYMLAVDPDHQGRGIGTALIQPVLTRCDQEGFPAYVENSKERNLTFYERNGFRVIEEFIPPKNGPVLWLMLRTPGG